jgi:hypothetical protein
MTTADKFIMLLQTSKYSAIFLHPYLPVPPSSSTDSLSRSETYPPGNSHWPLSYFPSDSHEVFPRNAPHHVPTAPLQSLSHSQSPISSLNWLIRTNFSVISLRKISANSTARHPTFSIPSKILNYRSWGRLKNP